MALSTPLCLWMIKLKVQRTLIKLMVGVIPPDPNSPHNLPPGERSMSEDEGPVDYDLFVCEQQPPVATSISPSGSVVPPTVTQTPRPFNGHIY